MSKQQKRREVPNLDFDQDRSAPSAPSFSWRCRHAVLRFTHLLFVDLGCWINGCVLGHHLPYLFVLLQASYPGTLSSLEAG